ncbi:hypothetical protein Tco_1208538 [Tanacetum coccineum]
MLTSSNIQSWKRFTLTVLSALRQSGNENGWPKDQGGLGLKNLQTWNHALLAKHDIKEDSEDSWGWENLLEVRDQIRDNVIYKDKLVTQDKLSKWGNQAVNSMEKSSEYDRDQVFEYEWKTIIYTLIKASNGSSINSVVRRLIFAASVYNIWAERNRRIFQDRKMNDNDIFKRIVDVVKSKISGLIVKDSYAIKNMEDKWKVSCKRLPMKIAEK